MAARSRKHGFLRVLAALLLAVLVVTGVNIWNYGGIDEARPCDVAIVLGAETWGEEPSPVFEERIDHAVWLYEQNYVDAILMTGGYEEGAGSSEAAIARAYAVAQGVPAESVLIEEGSHTTQENLANAQQVMDGLGLETAVVVSDPLHMLRAMTIAKDLGLDAVSSPTPTTRYVSWGTQLSFLLREEFYYLGYLVAHAVRLA